MHSIFANMHVSFLSCNGLLHVARLTGFMTLSLSFFFVKNQIKCMEDSVEGMFHPYWLNDIAIVDFDDLIV